MNNIGIKGASFSYESFKPKGIKGKSENPKFKGFMCQGFKINVIDRDTFRSVLSSVLSLEIAYSMYKGPLELNELRMKKLWGNDQIISFLKEEVELKQFSKELNKGVKKFKSESRPYLLYN